ncbi:MAG TPA: glycoside hydrolase family 3 protein, partial [Bacteroidota bacterium]|nr:glycoside hydrolase family 3 protein [Bacteroidota bacterium]
MSIKEKVAQTICIWQQKKALLFDDSGNLDHKKLKENLSNGVGQVARLSDTNGGLTPQQMADLANALQKFLLEETRLGIPAIFHEECLHGLVAIDATSYPQPIGLASTFNPELIEAIYAATAEDTRARGAHQALTPVVDVAREPRWGRVEETFGEDPYLVSQMGIAAVRGLQGRGSFPDPKRVIATLKHFAAHGQPESGSNCGPVNVSERLLRDTFLVTFKEAIKKGNALSVMPSYNEIDGVPSHANRWLLQDVLRKEWQFTGMLVSDYFAITELNKRDEATSFAVAHDKADAALQSAKAGVNVETPDPDCYPQLEQLVQLGTIPESQLDQLISPILKFKFLLGLFDNPYVTIDPEKHKQVLENDRQRARRAAQETITLLKNNGNILPLPKESTGSIAVIGPNADRTLLGGYSGHPRYFTSVLQGIREKVGKKIDLKYAEGCKVTVGGSWNEDVVTLPDPAENRRLISAAVTTAMESELVILVLGDNEQTSREA